MKQLSTILLFTLAIGLSARGEYSGSMYDFVIETCDGRMIEGHRYVTSFHIKFNDEEDSTTSILNTLLLYNTVELDEATDTMLYYHRHRLTYHYYEGIDQPDQISQVIDLDSINVAEIKKVRLTKATPQTYLMAIYNDLNLADTAWMQTELADKVFITLELCEYTLYLHEDNAEIRKLLKDIDTTLHPEIDENEEWPPIEEQEEQLTEKLKAMGAYKVMIISFCSC